MRDRRSPMERIKRQRLQLCGRMRRILIFRMLNPGYGSWKRVMIWNRIFRVL
jgi:hypothetical protein